MLNQIIMVSDFLWKVRFFQTFNMKDKNKGELSTWSQVTYIVFALGYSLKKLQFFFIPPSLIIPILHKMISTAAISKSAISTILQASSGTFFVSYILYLPAPRLTAQNYAAPPLHNAYRDNWKLSAGALIESDLITYLWLHISYVQYIWYW